MKIDAASLNPYTLLQGADSRARGNFLASLQAASETPASGSAAAITGPKTPQEELAEYLKKSPAEHMRDAVLKELGITEAELAAMPPEKRIAMEETITEKIKEKLLHAENNAQRDGQALLAMVAFATDAQKVLIDKR